MEETFSSLSVPRCYMGQLAAAVRELLVADAGKPEKENICRWMPLPSNGSEDVTVDTSVCV
jgi:hypothetical protein